MKCVHVENFTKGFTKQRWSGNNGRFDFLKYFPFDLGPLNYYIILIIFCIFCKGSI
jgi:hypothetical protein